MLRMTIDTTKVAQELKTMRENGMKIQSVQDNNDGTTTVFTC